MSHSVSFSLYPPTIHPDAATLGAMMSSMPQPTQSPKKDPKRPGMPSQITGADLCAIGWHTIAAVLQLARGSHAGKYVLPDVPDRQTHVAATILTGRICPVGTGIMRRTNDKNGIFRNAGRRPGRPTSRAWTFLDELAPPVFDRPSASAVEACPTCSSQHRQKRFGCSDGLTLYRAARHANSPVRSHRTEYSSAVAARMARSSLLAPGALWLVIV